MAGRESIKVVFSYAHKDEDHHGRLAAQLDRLKDDRKIDSWDDREIGAGADWDREIRERFEEADIILLLVSPAFLNSKYVREKEIPQAIEQAKAGTSVLVPVILEEDEQRDWKQIEGLSSWQALPPTATPIAEWPSRDVAYAEVARGIRALAEGLKAGIDEEVEERRKTRDLTVFPQYPFRIVGEDYDPFHAFDQVFRRVENRQFQGLPSLPLAVPLGRRVDFVRRDYRSILTELRHGDAQTGLPYDLAAIPYWILGHCVEAGLIQPLDDDLREPLESDFTWWREMGEHDGRLYGVPLSALTMVLAIRKDLFDAHGLQPPDSWEEYLAVVDRVAAEPILDHKGRPIAPDLLQGRCHITLWYDWLNHLYAHDSNDRELYGGNRYAPREAAETLRAGTLSYLELAEKLAPYAAGTGDLPHYATANWDDGIEMFADGRLLTHFVFNDALETLRTRMEVASQAAGRPLEVQYLPVPGSHGSGARHGHVEGWVLCIPTATKYRRAANAVLDWFLDVEIQRNYASWGGSSAHRLVIDEQAERSDDGGAGKAYKESVQLGLDGKASVRLVKYKGARALPAIDRIVANLYDAVLAVGRRQMTAEEATDTMIKSVEKRLLKGRG
jgi:ABC-type glycerol-3-phosphate transport system substrate-binding protein